MDPFLETLDYFVDDLLSSDVHLLRGELDFLIIQHLLNSVDLKELKNNELQNNNSLAA